MNLSFVHIPLCLVMLVLFLTGCRAPLAVKQIQAKNPLAKNTAKTPVKIVDMWNSYAQTDSNGKAVRGMAGKVHFFDDSKEEQAVKVDGDLTVYVFDGTETDPAHTKPIKVFRFKSDTLEKYYAFEKPLGHGYNFFLPIDEVGGVEKPLCIISRFEDRLKENTYVLAPSVNTVLPGRRPELDKPSIREYLDSQSLQAENQQRLLPPRNSGVRQTSYAPELKPEEKLEKKVEKKKSDRTATIPLNSGITRRLMESGAP